MRVRLLENLHSLELRHQEEPADSSHGHTTGRRPHTTTWLCATLGSEDLCVNVSCRFEDSDSGQVQTRLSHSFHLLNDTGIHLPGRVDFTHHCLVCLLSPSVLPTQGFLTAAVLG